MRPWKFWQPHWREKGNKRIFWYTIVTLFAAMALPYSIINQIMGYFDRSVIDPILPIDTWVPFIGWTFVIYLSLYLYYPAAAWFGRTSDERIREMFAFYQALFVMTEMHSAIQANQVRTSFQPNTILQCRSSITIISD